MPNPSWTLSDGETAALEQVLDSLPGASSSSTLGPDGLGFREVQVSNLSVERGAVALALLRPGSVVLEFSDGSSTNLDDAKSASIRSLLPAIEKHVDAPVLAEITSALSR